MSTNLTRRTVGTAEKQQSPKTPTSVKSSGKTSVSLVPAFNKYFSIWTVVSLIMLLTFGYYSRVLNHSQYVEHTFGEDDIDDLKANASGHVGRSPIVFFIVILIVLGSHAGFSIIFVRNFMSYLFEPEVDATGAPTSPPSLLNKLLQVLSMIIVIYLQAATFIQQVSYIYGELRPAWFRLLFTYPAAVFNVISIFYVILVWTTTTIISFVAVPKFSPAASIQRRNIKAAFVQILVWIPIIGSLIGLHHTLYPQIHARNSELFGEFSIDLRKVNELSSSKVITIAQLSDIHLGPMMSVEDLQKVSKDIVSHQENIDLVLLTGDFYTFESQRAEFALSKGLQSFKQISSNKLFACLGNHDHEIPSRIVASELRRSNVQLLVDDAKTLMISNAEIKTPLKVQVVGIDYKFNWQARDHIQAEFAKLYKDTSSDVALRVIMLHDPSGFRHIPQDPNGVKQIVFSGHYHGGQFGLHRFGLSWSVISGFIQMPDYQFFCNSKADFEKVVKFSGTVGSRERICHEKANFLYVSAGTGFYGLPLRFGTSNERNTLVNVVL